jgi:hypothetical protein
VRAVAGAAVRAVVGVAGAGEARPGVERPAGVERPTGVERPAGDERPVSTGVCERRFRFVVLMGGLRATVADIVIGVLDYGA